MPPLHRVNRSLRKRVICRDLASSSHTRGLCEPSLAYYLPEHTVHSAANGLIKRFLGLDLMQNVLHHKYVIRDRESVWTGSMNWTQDSWTRQENANAIVHSRELAYAYGLNFDELWETGDVVDSGKVEPRPVDVGGVEVRPWFSPEHGEVLAHRIAKRLGQARRRIRIASPVLSSGPILGTLAEICSDGKVDVAGIVDDTQVDGVLYQWWLNGNASWKVPALRRFLEAAGFAGKPSTNWSPDTVHDFMHAKIVVADDVSFLGSFNLSHSGELNAENVLELKDAAIADRLAAFVDEIRALYPLVTIPEDKTPAPAASPLL